MATTIYGLDWVNGDGLNYAYTELADAKLDVLEYLLDTYISHIPLHIKNNALKDLSDELALDSESIVEDHYVYDLVYITYIDVHDGFKP